MTEDAGIVIAEPLQRPVLPEWLNGAVALLLHLVATGRWEEIAQRLRVQREGGYSGIDGFLFLLLFFGSGKARSISGFSQAVSLHGGKLAALAGRKSLPQQSSMSRLLQAVELDVVRELAPWLLWEATGAAELLAHPVMQTVDANGEGWHIFDYDPTKTVLRQRSLPRGEDLPPARRRADSLTAPGYPGRKRGEVQVSRATLQHAGSGLWVGARLSPGNGDGRPSLRASIERITSICAELGHPLLRAVLRLDGEHGNVPYLSMCVEAGLPALSRLNRPKLLDQPDVRRRLATGAWYMVPDSGSGPRRSAMDLGMVTVRPGKDSVRDDGTPFDPIEVRVVVSRYARDGKADHGVVIDGWQYELFAAVQLPADAWPAPEVVAMYFGRGGQENRFAQEDRELGLDRIFSNKLPGQELACLVGLMVWNLQVVHGFHLDPPPADRAPAPPREIVVDDRPVPPDLTPVEEPVEPEPLEAPAESSPQEALADALRELDWAHLLRRRRDWRFDSEQGALHCPAGERMSLSTVDTKSNAKTSRLLFRAPPGSCEACPLRSKCLSSARVDALKLLGTTVPKEAGTQLAALLAPVHRARRSERSNQALERPLPSGRARRLPAGEPLAVDVAVDTSTPSGTQIDVAPFLPAAARRAFRRAVEPLAVRIKVKKPVVGPPHPYLAEGPAKRQRRRATWTERLAWYALPEGAQVRTVVHAGAALAATFPWAAQT